MSSILLLVSEFLIGVSQSCSAVQRHPLVGKNKICPAALRGLSMPISLDFSVRNSQAAIYDSREHVIDVPKRGGVGWW